MDELQWLWILFNRRSKNVLFKYKFAGVDEIHLFYRTAFNEMNSTNKEQTIRQNLEQLISDIPAYIEMLENVANSFDEKIGWKEFKFCFKLATSQIVRHKFCNIFVAIILI